MQRGCAPGEDPNEAWRKFSIHYYSYALNWILEGEAKTSTVLAAGLTCYLSTLSLESARHLRAIHCKEILLAALIVTDKAPLEACIRLKLHGYLDPEGLASILSLAIELDHSSFLSLLSDETEAIQDDAAYNEALRWALSHVRYGCLGVLLKYVHPHHTSASYQSSLDIDLEAMLGTLFSGRQHQFYKEPSKDIDQSKAFLSCLELLIDLGQALTDGTNTNPIQGLKQLSQTATEAELDTNAGIFSFFLKHVSSKEDQKAILALFLDKGWLTCHFCQEHPIFSPIYEQMQSLRRSKKTKKAYSDA